MVIQFLRCEFSSSWAPPLNADASVEEAISVLGWARWRALDSAHTMGELEHSLERLNDAPAGSISIGCVDTLIDTNMLVSPIVLEEHAAAMCIRTHVLHPVCREQRRAI